MSRIKFIVNNIKTNNEVMGLIVITNVIIFTILPTFFLLVDLQLTDWIYEHAARIVSILPFAKVLVNQSIYPTSTLILIYVGFIVLVFNVAMLSLKLTVSHLKKKNVYFVFLIIIINYFFIIYYVMLDKPINLNINNKLLGVFKIALTNKYGMSYFICFYFIYVELIFIFSIKYLFLLIRLFTYRGKL